MDELLSEFLTETNESLAQLDTDLVQLERTPDRPELVDGIFRLVHTIKGTCGFLDLPRLEAVAHAAENVLGKVRDRELAVTPAAVSLVLEALDRIKMILSTLAATAAEPAGADTDLIARLDAFAAGEAVAAAPVAPPAPPPAPPAAEPEAVVPEVSLDDLERAFQAAPGPAPVAAVMAEAAPGEGDADVAAPEIAVANQNIRVSVDLLEQLMTMVSELVLTRNQLLQMVRGQADSTFTVPLQRLSHVTSELQEGVMKTRMQPIGNAWAKLPRIVRDLSLELGKRIELDMRGQDTELDRQVLELIRDPLTHMVRNSADHGLEKPAERVAAGKTEVGHIHLNAYHEGGHIILQIRDDGRGIDIEAVRRRIVDRSLVDPGEAAGLSDQQVMQYIFRPGFSTAAAVTSVSGRGVGMDVVRSNIEKIGGTIDMRSTAGRGTAFTIKIPLTLAIVSALIVESGGQRFAMPQISVVELVRAGGNSEHRIEQVNRTPVLRLRDRLLPLVYLDDCLSCATVTDRTEEAFIVVTQVGAERFGIVVDRVFDTEEIVVKPVAPILRHIPVFSGNTILGDGSVIMILDPNGIAQTTSASHPAEASDAEAAAAGPDHAADRVAMLLFAAGDPEPKSVPLSLVARLEEIAADQIESSQGRKVMQYRGRLMPLLDLTGRAETASRARQPMLVFSEGEHSMGLMVDEIIDIVDTELDMEMQGDRPGFLGSAVISGKATAILDVSHFLTQAHPDWFKGDGERRGGNASPARKVLLVDDSPFFRNLLRPLLEVAGYDVTVAGDGDQALKLRERGDRFDVIVSDIEMPGMSGFDLAQRIRAEGRWQETPLVALSSHASPRDFEQGREAGFTDYVRKMDRDALLASLSQTLEMERGAA